VIIDWPLDGPARDALTPAQRARSDEFKADIRKARRSCLALERWHVWIDGYLKGSASTARDVLLAADRIVATEIRDGLRRQAADDGSVVVGFGVSRKSVTGKGPARVWVVLPDQ
jgi:hypothetical protein